jgi:hypothetical protein
MVMNFFASLNKFTKLTLVTGVCLVIYGYVCRLGIYFFWESKYIGWNLLLISVIGFLSGRVKKNKAQKKNSIGEKIGVGFIIFLFVIETIMFIMILNTSVYPSIKKFIYNNSQLKSEIGNIKGISIVPFGGIGGSSGEAGETGEGEIHLIVKGDKKYKDLTMHVFKEIQTDWQIEIK